MPLKIKLNQSESISITSRLLLRFCDKLLPVPNLDHGSLSLLMPLLACSFLLSLDVDGCGAGASTFLPDNVTPVVPPKGTYSLVFLGLFPPIGT